jgi:hypothetical protein
MFDLTNLSKESLMKQETGIAVTGCGDGTQKNAIYLIAANACHSGTRGRFDYKHRLQKAKHPRCCLDRSTMKTDHAGSMRLAGPKGPRTRIDLAWNLQGRPGKKSDTRQQRATVCRVMVKSLSIQAQNNEFFQ